MFEFAENFGFQVVTALILSLVPALIWINILFKRGQQSKSVLAKLFLLGAWTVIPILGVQYLWLLQNNVGLYELIGQSIDDPRVGSTVTFIAIGAVEELLKFLSLVYFASIRKHIKSVNDAINMILAVALGYAFSENIFYFSNILRSGQLAELYSAVVLRSLFTMAAHMVFAGVVGYHYAIGKFGQPILEMDQWTGKKHHLLAWVKNKFKLEASSIFGLAHIGFGLVVAMFMHAAFNLALNFQRMEYSFAIVIVGFIYVMYLSRQRTSFLVFSEQEQARESTIGKAEEDVVIELVGMWLQEGKYNDVIHVCDRLAQRDPDNMLVKLFRAKAVDKKKMRRVKNAIKLLFSDDEYDVIKEEQSLFDGARATLLNGPISQTKPSVESPPPKPADDQSQAKDS